MIKTLSIITAILISSNTFGQLFIDVDDYVGRNILSIKKLDSKKDGWETIIEFSNDSLPSRETNYYNGVLRSDYHYSYEKTDSTYSETRVDSKNINDNFRKKIIYIDKKGILRKRELLTSPDKKSIYVERNFKYDTIGRIISFEKVFLSTSQFEGKGVFIDQFEFTYNEKNQIISAIKTDSENISKIVYTLSYNNEGLIESKIIDYNNPEVLLSDVPCWEKERCDKYGYFYKYDKYGNWTHRYFITKKGNLIDSKRLIEYK